ncbi:MAG: hypothetical protein WEB53_07125 [Akkermansiaceae bacterium]
MKVVSLVARDLDAQNLRYALIGGMAMAMRGLQRTTLDLDFILMLEDLNLADQILRKHGYTREFHSENVSHYIGKDSTLGRIDLLHAFRGPTLGMLTRAERLTWADRISLPVVHIEDLIGLKVQAFINDPTRQPGDWADCLAIIRHAGDSSTPIDWELVEDYLILFNLGDRLVELKATYGQAH